MNDVATLRPDLAAEWDEKLNDLASSEVTLLYSKSVQWKCKAGHMWSAPVNYRVKQGAGCQKCSARRNGDRLQKPSRGKSLADTHPDIAGELAYELNGGLTPLDVAPYTGRKLWWEAECGHAWRMAVRSRTLLGAGCSTCSQAGKSEPEKRLFAAVAEWLGDAVQSARIDGTTFGNRRAVVDIAGRYRGHLVAVEFDGRFWHRESQERDLRKTDVLRKAGYLVARVREGELPHLPPRKGLVQVSAPFLQGPESSTTAHYASVAAAVREMLDASIESDADPKRTQTEG